MITCQICGHQVKSLLTRHLKAAHQMTEEDYVRKYNSPVISAEFQKVLSDNGTRTMQKLWSNPDFRDEHSQRVSERNNLNWKNPEYQELMSRNGKSQWDDLEYKTKMKQIIKESWNDPEIRAKHCASMKRYCNSEEGLKNITKRWTHYREEYNGITYKSSWEVILAKFLERKHIKFEYENLIIPYVSNNQHHSYIPDFYLPDYNLIIEVKADWQIDSEITKIKADAASQSYRYLLVASDIINGLDTSSETIENSLLEEILIDPVSRVGLE